LGSGKSPSAKDLEHNLGVLHARLMSASGLVRENAVFTGDTVRPAVARCAVGLGFSPVELDGYARSLVAQGNPEGLIPVRAANDPEYSYFTTRAVVAAEQRIAQAASERVRDQSEGLPEIVLRKAIRHADVELDPEQSQVSRRSRPANAG
jgi:hypothetical protein